MGYHYYWFPALASASSMPMVWMVALGTPVGALVKCLHPLPRSALLGDLTVRQENKCPPMVLVVNQGQLLRDNS